jgi:hypothetical protein
MILPLVRFHLASLHRSQISQLRICERCRLRQQNPQSVRNFYKQEQTSFSVCSEVITWEAECLFPEQASYLPSMVTDVTLRSPLRTIVIDVKFYRRMLVNRRGGRPKIRANHISSKHVCGTWRGAAESTRMRTEFCCTPQLTAKSFD